MRKNKAKATYRSEGINQLNRPYKSKGKIVINKANDTHKIKEKTTEIDPIGRAYTTVTKTKNGTVVSKRKGIFKVRKGPNMN